MLLSLKATFDYLYLPKLIDDEDRFFEYHFCQGESVDKDRPLLFSYFPFNIEFLYKKTFECVFTELN